MGVMRAALPRCEKPDRPHSRAIVWHLYSRDLERRRLRLLRLWLRERERLLGRERLLERERLRDAFLDSSLGSSFLGSSVSDMFVNCPMA